MSETRYVEQFDTKGNLTGKIPYVVSDEELAVEKERDALSNAADLIDAITTLAQAKEFLKRLVARLIKNGLIP